MVRDQITPVQLATFIFLVIIGTHFLVMPRLVAAAGGRDGWLALVGGAAIALGMVGVLVKLGRRFPGQTVIQYNTSLYGRIFGNILSIWLMVHFTLAASFGLRFFGDMLKLFLFDRTPLELIMLLILFTAAYAVRHGLNVLVRLAEVFTPIVLVFVAITLVVLQLQMDYRNLLPVMARGIMPVGRALFPGYFVFQGYGLLFFALPLVADSRQSFRSAAAALGVALVLYLSIFAGAIGIFGPQQLSLLIYPTVDLARALEIPEMIIERQEILLLTVWILVNFISVAGSFYAVSVGASQLLGLREFSPLVYLVLPLIYLGAILPQNVAQVSLAQRILAGSFIALSVVYLAGFGLSYLRPKGGRNRA